MNAAATTEPPDFSPFRVAIRALSEPTYLMFKKLGAEQKAKVERYYNRHHAMCEKHGVAVDRVYLLELIGDVRRGLM